ncbi:MAG: hypothetical protein Q8J64_06530 [Thermodesulfovibrionales bacterium]|nr:hypothetical protein [Thermodesulfovibrionales bacterium]
MEGLIEKLRRVVVAAAESDTRYALNGVLFDLDGLIALERQENIFELQYLSEEETKSVTDFDALLRSVERFLVAVDGEKRLKHLEKAVFGGVSVERIDFIIRGLQKVRKTVFKGEGAKEALEAA